MDIWNWVLTQTNNILVIKDLIDALSDIIWLKGNNELLNRTKLQDNILNIMAPNAYYLYTYIYKRTCLSPSKPRV